ncbi:MAG: RluA family pseudouridine synthase [Paenibacillus sp.]|nr:RluA family pseudouridine synthase [Paenibacillus sp.]
MRQAGRNRNHRDEGRAGPGKKSASSFKTRGDDLRAKPARKPGRSGDAMHGGKAQTAASKPVRAPLPAANAGKAGRAAASLQGAAPQPKLTTSLKAWRRRGEWWETKLPDHLMQAPIGALLKMTPIPAKLAGRLIAANGAVKQGQWLRLKLFPLEAPGFPADWAELNILYEDDFSLVVNKPIGVEVHPSVQGQRGTLAHAVAAYYEATGQQCRVRHIHRLDKDTTGPVLYAKNEFAHYEYDKAMREKHIERLYIAVAEGPFEQRKGKIDKPIGQDRHHSTRRRVSETGEPAVTWYEVAETFLNHTLVRLRLETGRTHQIRVHLSSINHPLAGDGMYGGGRKYIHRQALHGEKLIWHHPWTNERIEVQAPLSEDMSKLLQTLRDEM